MRSIELIVPRVEVNKKMSCNLKITEKTVYFLSTSRVNKDKESTEIAAAQKRFCSSEQNNAKNQIETKLCGIVTAPLGYLDTGDAHDICDNRYRACHRKQRCHRTFRLQVNWYYVCLATRQETYRAYINAEDHKKRHYTLRALQSLKNSTVDEGSPIEPNVK